VLILFGTTELGFPVLLNHNSSPTFLQSLILLRCQSIMAIIVQKASVADVPRVCEIETAAYAEHPANTVLFPGPFPSDSIAKRAERLITEIKSDQTALCLKAVDEETGETVAFAKWHIYKTPEAVAAAERVLVFGPGTNQEACYAFFGGMIEKKKEILGNKPHICTSLVL
jgi:hypothetical protein